MSRKGTKIYTYQGFSGTLPNVCKHFNIKIKLCTIYQRMETGMSLEDAIVIEKLSRLPKNTKIYTYQGFSGTLPEVYKHFNIKIKLCTICQRIQNGMSLEDAINSEYLSRLPKNTKIYTYKGVAGTLPKVCDHFGRNYGTVQLRMKKGMSFEEAIGVPVQRRGRI